MPRARSKGPTGMPGWVKGFIWAGAALLVFLVFMLASGHGPWQHMGTAGMH